MDDPKCMILIDQLGMEGYGIFWGLIERLRQEKEYKLPTSVLPSLAKRWGTSSEKVQTVVSKYGLFVMEEDGFFSERLRRSMIEKSQKGRIGAEKRWSNATAMQLHSPPIATAMQTDAIKVKESKGNERKVKESKSVCESIKSFFGFDSEQKHIQKWIQISTFVNSLEDLKHFEHQFEYYIKFKHESKQTIHSFSSFIDGGWDAENWEKKYNDLLKSNPDSWKKNFKPITIQNEHTK